MEDALRRRIEVTAKLAAVTALLIAVSAAPAAANHSWGGYHWARTANPFTVKLGDNVTSAWDGHLATASSDWSAHDVLKTTVVPGLTTGRKCRASSGRVEVCNAAYGNNGWLGLASVWASGGHIVQATVKLNDTYFSTAKYNTPSWRQSVTCQEVGHTFGLDHQSEDPNVNMGTCMDYYKVPNIRPNQHDFDQLALIYGHLDSTSTLAASTASGRRGLRKVKETLYVEELGAGKRRLVWVYWKDQGVRHGAPDEG
jgi:hypothetical protein